MGTVKVNGFTYNAEPYDATTGMLNLRARQYESAMNRFSQKDMHSSSLVLTLAWNEYLFTYNYPLNWIDANGLIPDDPSDENVQKEYIAEQRNALFNVKARTACEEAVNGNLAAVGETFSYFQRNYNFLQYNIRKEYDAVYEEYIKEQRVSPRVLGLMLQACAKIAEIDFKQPIPTVLQTQPTSKKESPPLNKLEGIVYALEHCENPNTVDYKNYDIIDGASDCANYISQVLYNMGMPMWNADNLKLSGWINDRNGNVSTSWKGAQSLYYSLVGAKNKYNNYETSAYFAKTNKILLSEPYEFTSMNLVFIKYKGDNSYGHVMLVVGFDSNGETIIFQRGSNFNSEYYSHFVERYSKEGGYNGRKIEYITVVTLDDLRNR